MEWFSDFGMREWLISCGIVLVLVVLADGFRRMRAERRGEIKMSLRMGGEFPDLPAEDFSAELPNGGARVVDRGVESPEDPFRDADGYEMPEIMADEAVPSQVDIAAGRQPDAGQEAMAAVADRPVPPLDTEQQIFVLHAKAPGDEGFNGSDLLEVLLACDLRYGDRDILHRHEHAGGTGQLQFSVANMLEPGTFNLEDIGSFRTPGVTFFMTLPGADRPDEALDCMLETANCLSKNLDAELYDENHQPLTPQVIDDYRQRVRAFCGAPA